VVRGGLHNERRDSPKVSVLPIWYHGGGPFVNSAILSTNNLVSRGGLIAALCRAQRVPAGLVLFLRSDAQRGQHGDARGQRAC